MASTNTIKINFIGGIISPGDLYNVLVAASKAGVFYVKFGLRQQLLIDIEIPEILAKELDMLSIKYELNANEYPNLVSSYPAEEVFITNTWLSEGVYKDIFDHMDFQPTLKINVSDCNQSFTPLLTGNINWVASPDSQHFWHLFIRFPKTNIIYEWKDMLYTNDVARMSKQLETLILQHKEKFYDNVEANGNFLYQLIDKEQYITKPVTEPLKLPAFNLPYYEGVNRYNDKYWLGIYRRDEMFAVDFLKDLCLLSLQTKIGQICSSPWKSLIIKGIEEKDKLLWSKLLAKHQVNVRHAANELNFQVEDNCKDGLDLKKYLVRYLSNDDTRTFGICIGIKMRKKSEIFCSILIRRKSLLRIGNFSLINLYDVLYAKDFNPNERTGSVFSKNNLKIFLPEQLRRALVLFNTEQSKAEKSAKKPKKERIELKEPKLDEYVYQCCHCLTVYDEAVGEPENEISAGTIFNQLPKTWHCSICESPREDFRKIKKSELGLQAI